jgi:DNA helicase IV
MPADAGPAAAQTATADEERSAGESRSAAESTTNDTEDSVIAGERAHLLRSREFLHLMRENVLTLAQNPMAADRVSLEYLKADLYRRAEALKDLPDAPLFFGRLDYSELAKTDEDFAGANFHIGRRHVHDDDGTPVVLDWRAPVSRPFYQASPSNPG